MSAPLGRTAGNGLEVRESLEVLAGGGPADVVELTCALAREMLAAAGVEDADVEAALADGRAMDSWRAMISAQGGDVDAPLPEAKHVEELRASEDGVVTGLDAMGVGVAAWRLGAGRSRPGEAVQAAAGVEIEKHLGEEVRAGDVLARLHTDTPERMGRALEALEGSWTLAEAGTVLPERRIVIDRIA
jgi:thymidine phosphorylase